jgi:hypothetical protein
MRYLSKKIQRFFWIARRRWLGICLVLISVVSVVIMLKTSTDPALDGFHGTWIGKALQPFPTGNQIGFDLSVGLLVSVFFYLLVVAVPAQRKRRQIKRHLLREYSDLKRDCLYRILWACVGSVGEEQVTELLDRDKFKEFFRVRVDDNMDRWHVVQNELQSDPMKLAELVEPLNIFRGELAFALSVIDIDDPESLSFARRLDQVLSQGSEWEADYDDVKLASVFFWSLYTGWDRLHGYSGRDHIREFIEAL